METWKNRGRGLRDGAQLARELTPWPATTCCRAIWQWLRSQGFSVTGRCPHAGRLGPRVVSGSGAVICLRRFSRSPTELVVLRVMAQARGSGVLRRRRVVRWAVGSVAALVIAAGIGGAVAGGALGSGPHQMTPRSEQVAHRRTPADASPYLHLVGLPGTVRPVRRSTGS